MTTGARIRSARQKAGITQAELAQKLGIPYQSVSQWERDTRNPKIETLQRIADALDTPVEVLLGIGDSIGPVGTTGTAFMEELAQGAIDAMNHSHTHYAHSLGIASFGKFKLVDALPAKSLKSTQVRISAALDKLNEDGQQKAVERVEELTEIPRYRRQDAPPEGTPTADTPGTEPPPESAENGG